MSEKTEIFCYKYKGVEFTECHKLEAVLSAMFYVQIEQVLVEVSDVDFINDNIGGPNEVNELPPGKVLILNHGGEWWEMVNRSSLFFSPVDEPILWSRTVTEILNETGVRK